VVVSWGSALGSLGGWVSSFDWIVVDS
jgi:hypothetical protein